MVIPTAGFDLFQAYTLGYSGLEPGSAHLINFFMHGRLTEGEKFNFMHRRREPGGHVLGIDDLSWTCFVGDAHACSYSYMLEACMGAWVTPTSDSKPCPRNIIIFMVYKYQL